MKWKFWEKEKGETSPSMDPTLKFTVSVSGTAYAVAPPSFGRFFGVCQALGVKDFGEGLIRGSVDKLIKIGLLPVQVESVDGVPDESERVLEASLAQVWTGGKLGDLLANLLDGYKPVEQQDVAVAEVEAAVLYFFMTYSNASIPLAVQAMLSARPSRNLPPA